MIKMRKKEHLNPSVLWKGWMIKFTAKKTKAYPAALVAEKVD
jgi:hypothetical protein